MLKKIDEFILDCIHQPFVDFMNGRATRLQIALNATLGATVIHLVAAIYEGALVNGPSFTTIGIVILCAHQISMMSKIDEIAVQST
jgi:hypothetical protein